MRLISVAMLSGAAAVLVAVGAFAATSKPVEIRDAKADVTGVLDLQRGSLRRASDGRLRASVTLAGKLDPKAMLAKSGPPGSVCLKVWTDAGADPAAARPDRLVCVTARSDGDLRASVFEETARGLPRRLGAASVTLNKSARSLVLRVSQSALGRPELMRFAIESTLPGCERVSCVDEVPDKGAVRRFRLRGSA